MILLIDDEKHNKCIKLKDSLAGYGLPVIITGSRHAADYPEALAAFVFVPSEDYLNTVSLRCGRIPILAVNESGSRIYNKDVVFYDKALFDSYEDFILGYFSENYGISLSNLTIGELSVTNVSITVGLSSLKLTDAERRILILMMLCRGKWVSENSINRACLDTSSKSRRVPVHICNLNNKVRSAAGRKLILCKRGVGYMLDPYL